MTSVASPPEAKSDARESAATASHGWRVRAMWSLYTLTLRQHFRGKRWMVLAALFLLPVGLAILIRTTAADVPGLAIEFMLAFMFMPHAILPLIALIYASGIVQDEQEGQTITYLVVRPISKPALYIVKLLATLTTTTFLTTIFTVLCYATIYLGGDESLGTVAVRCLKAALIHSLAVTAYCCLFGLFSLLTKRILVVGIIYIALVEGLLANLPFGIRLITVIYYARLIAFRTMGFVVPTPDGRKANMAAEAWQLDVRADPLLIEHPQLSTCLTVLLVGSLVCTLFAAWMCSQREFHVKTPDNE